MSSANNENSSSFSRDFNILVKETGLKTRRLKTREWKTRHQTAAVENAGVTSMESQNSPYLTLLQVGYNSQ